MSFVLQRVTARGLVLNQVSGDALRIGRGTNADLRSDNPAVSLEHAVISTDAAGYAITDKGSITGTYVNRKPVESARLSKGDVIEIGDLRVEVQLAEAARPLFLRVVQSAARKAGQTEEEEAAAPVAGGGVVKAPKIDYADAFRLKRPYFTKLSLVALLTIAALAVVAEVIRPERQTIFMPGGVSSAHARGGDNGKSVAKDCKACHEPWRGVTDQRCVACHARAPHAATEAATPPCLSCHPEHRDAPKLALMDDAKCVGCHANLQAHLKPGVSVRPAIAQIAVFGDKHPDLTYPPDPDTLRFNHQLHLRPAGVFNGEGRREVLECTSCHKLLASGETIDPKPVKFAADCQRCHKLTFDRRFPTDEVPHGGDPGVVYGFVIGMYSGNRELAGKSPEEIRRILTTRPRSSDDRSAVYAEQVIKTKCALCHDIRPAGNRLAVTPPGLQTRWLASVPFDHGGKHASVRCENCHESARESTRTQDVMMPSRKDCVACHGADGKSATTCVTCHRYHEDSKSLPAKMVQAGLVQTGGDRAEMLGTILLAAIVILLLVLLVPVGVAVYQRLRVKPEERITEKRPAAQPTAKMAAITIPPPPPAPAAEAAAATPKGTVAAPLVRDRSTDERNVTPQATELVQWYGMLLCTAGPLEGQRFIVEDDGVYIGRDAALSQIVVPDSRVSKRHVRIVPRDGKVHAIDQGSTNGTFLGSAGGQRITEVQLKRGDTIVLADNAAAFLYQI
jgi:pSer/pThr/pTyr-binding forkhead associated (FHA) protein